MVSFPWTSTVTHSSTLTATLLVTDQCCLVRLEFECDPQSLCVGNFVPSLSIVEPSGRCLGIWSIDLGRDQVILLGSQFFSARVDGYKRTRLAPRLLPCCLSLHVITLIYITLQEALSKGQINRVTRSWTFNLQIISQINLFPLWSTQPQLFCCSIGKQNKTKFPKLDYNYINYSMKNIERNVIINKINILHIAFKPPTISTKYFPFLMCVVPWYWPSFQLNTIICFLNIPLFPHNSI